MKRCIFELRNVSKKYRSFKKSNAACEALKDISLSFPSRGLVFVTGKSGAGKSTLLNIIGGLDKPTSGEILIEGKSTSDLRSKDYNKYRNNYIGFIFQEYNLLERFNVAENIGLSLKLKKKVQNESQKVSEVLKEVNLDNFGKRKIATLSGGQKQRVAIARALIKDPYIILADEPTGALDSENGSQVLDILKKISAKRLVIVVSHDEDYAAKYADYKIELTDGRVTSSNLKDDYGDEVVEKREFDEHSSSLAFLEKAKIAFKYMLSRPLRLAVTLLLAATSLGIFGLADTLSTFDQIKVTANSLMNSGENFLSLGRLYPDKLFSSHEIESIKNKTNIDFSGVFNSFFTVEFSSAILSTYYYNYLNYYLQSTHFLKTVDTIEQISPEYSMLCGRLPNKTGEIAITDYQFEIFKEYGFKDISVVPNEMITPDKLVNPAVLLGKHLVINKNIYNEDSENKTIVGIIDTEFDPLHYKDLAEYTRFIKFDSESSSTPPLISKLRDELFNLRQETYLDVCFISKEEMDQIISEKNEYAIDSNISFTVQISPSRYGILQTNSANVLDSSVHNVVFFSDHKTDELKENEFIIPLKDYINQVLTSVGDLDSKSFDLLIPQEFLYNSSEDMIIANISYEKFSEASFLNDYIYRIGYNYLADRYAVTAFDNHLFDTQKYSNEVYPNNTTGQFTDEEKHDIFTYYLSRVFYFGVESESQYERDLYDEFVKIITGYLNFFVEKYQDVLFKNTDFVCKRRNSSGDNEYESHDFKLVGFSVLPKEQTILYVNESQMENICRSSYQRFYIRLMAPMPNDIDKISKLLHIYLKDAEDSDVIDTFYISNTSEGAVYTLVSKIRLLSRNFLIVSVALAVFSFLLLFNYLSTSIVDKNKEIGILRALGTSKKDILSIFIFESLFITLLSYALSVAVLFIASFLANSTIMTSSGVFVTLFMPDVRQVFIILGLNLFISLTGTCIPIFKLHRKEIITMINS